MTHGYINVFFVLFSFQMILEKDHTLLSYTYNTFTLSLWTGSSNTVSYPLLHPKAKGWVERIIFEVHISVLP